jgi:hypothetical protein
MGIESGINVRKKRVKINKREGIKINRIGLILYGL